MLKIRDEANKLLNELVDLDQYLSEQLEWDFLFPDESLVSAVKRLVSGYEADVVACREQLAQETERAESYRLDVAAIRDALEAPEDADINQLIDIVHALTEQVERAQLPEPDHTNPAHLRFCAGLLALISVREGNAMASNHYGYGLPFTGNHLIDLAKHLEAAQQQADADEELIEKAAQAIFSSGGISNGQLLAMDSDRRAEVIASLSLEVRRNLAHIAILGASRLIKESVRDDSHHKAKRADEFAELAANLLRDGGEK